MVLLIQNIKICGTSFTDNLHYILNLVNFFIQLPIYILLMGFSAQSKHHTKNITVPEWITLRKIAH